MATLISLLDFSENFIQASARGEECQPFTLELKRAGWSKSQTPTNKPKIVTRSNKKYPTLTIYAQMRHNPFELKVERSYSFAFNESPTKVTILDSIPLLDLIASDWDFVSKESCISALANPDDMVKEWRRAENSKIV